MQVLTRYVLEKLFGPGVAGLTNDENILYLDLPPNMVSLSLSFDACTHIQSILKDSLGKKMHLNYFTFDIKMCLISMLF